MSINFESFSDKQSNFYYHVQDQLKFMSKIVSPRTFSTQFNKSQQSMCLEHSQKKKKFLKQQTWQQEIKQLNNFYIPSFLRDSSVGILNNVSKQDPIISQKTIKANHIEQNVGPISNSPNNSIHASSINANPNNVAAVQTPINSYSSAFSNNYANQEQRVTKQDKERISGLQNMQTNENNQRKLRYKQQNRLNQIINNQQHKQQQVKQLRYSRRNSQSPDNLEEPLKDQQNFSDIKLTQPDKHKYSFIKKGYRKSVSLMFRSYQQSISYNQSVCENPNSLSELKSNLPFQSCQPNEQNEQIQKQNKIVHRKSSNAPCQALNEWIRKSKTFSNQNCKLVKLERFITPTLNFSFTKTPLNLELYKTVERKQNTTLPQKRNLLKTVFGISKNGEIKSENEKAKLNPQEVRDNQGKSDQSQANEVISGMLQKGFFYPIISQTSIKKPLNASNKSSVYGGQMSDYPKSSKRSSLKINTQLKRKGISENQTKIQSPRESQQQSSESMQLLLNQPKDIIKMIFEDCSECNQNNTININANNSNSNNNNNNNTIDFNVNSERRIKKVQHHPKKIIFNKTVTNLIKDQNELKQLLQEDQKNNIFYYNQYCNKNFRDFSKFIDDFRSKLLKESIKRVQLD
eukprot:TRINITY_DN2854_c0_g1_i1.p1 TRINITY_DN2854_c0_g1~~TRINITY_DN2854_c0_g1_i1.p1  ORF type:complete len:630 (+),score=84.69 TRINITY_DN2854_c0_g1_i1:60-1949(+)